MADPLGRAPRPHKKSRAGCKSCKARKVKVRPYTFVPNAPLRFEAYLFRRPFYLFGALILTSKEQCDETWPSCTSCLRRHVSCEYAAPQIKDGQVERQAYASSDSPERHKVSPSPPYRVIETFELALSVESTERRLLEMQLMHHFVTKTVRTDFLSIHDENILEMWSSTAPSLALKYPFLLNTILSIAALHITKIDPEQKDMADVHRAYFNAAISGHRHVIRDINPDNAEAVCIATILIALPPFILLQSTAVEEYAPPLQIFHLLAGNKPLFRQALPLVPRTSKVLYVITTKPNIHDFEQEIRRDIHRQVFSHLSQWRAPGEVVDPDSLAAYNYMLNFVGCILNALENGVDVLQIRRMLYSLPTLTPSIYVERLQDRNPRALVILAYYFSLAKAVDGVWWMRGIAEREVLGIQTILPEHWQWAMAWPITKIALYAASTTPQIPTSEAS
ncbi:MAG: hypothetical protein M1818_002295 [Claussenomyces sp. TS43310]|nr:MAG: hypothetical protein M1818_002295 [Claussenomyces sp. TS43310]